MIHESHDRAIYEEGGHRTCPLRLLLFICCVRMSLSVCVVGRRTVKNKMIGDRNWRRAVPGQSP